MKLKNLKVIIGCDCITTTVVAVKVSFKKEIIFVGVNDKADFFGFFPFSWFVF